MNLSGKTHIKISGDSDIWPLDGIISGMHEPESSHLELLEAFGGSKLLSPIGLIAHKFNLKEHEFGDSMLIL
jgi:S-adenosylmethionine:tRNA-ribosyltransferase-isomerase (queuine synthetase)